MAKFNLRVFKSGKPIYWIIGAVVLFVIFYLLFSRGGSGATDTGSSNIVVTNSGPSEQMQMAQLSASTAMQTAQLGAQIEMARVQGDLNNAQLGAQVALAQLAGAENISLAQLRHEAAMTQLTSQTQLIMNEQNVEYSLENARLAAETHIVGRQMDAAVLIKQMETSRDMLSIQSANLITQSAIGQVSNLKKKDRDNALVAIYGSATGNPVPYIQDRSGGGLGGLLSFVSPLTRAIA